METRKDACAALGVSAFASDAEIKTAYKNLVKQFHPDAGNTADAARYQRVLEAYEYLREHPATVAKPRIIGSKSDFRQKREEQEAFDRWYQERMKARKQEFENRVAEERKKAEQKQKQEDEYRRAMEAINNIILAETIKSMIAAGKPKNIEESEE